MKCSTIEPFTKSKVPLFVITFTTRLTSFLKVQKQLLHPHDGLDFSYEGFLIDISREESFAKLPLVGILQTARTPFKGLSRVSQQAF